MIVGGGAAVQKVRHQPRPSRMDMQAEDDQCKVKSSAFGNGDVDEKRQYRDVEKNEKVLCELEMPAGKQTAHAVLVKHREDPQKGHEDMCSVDKQVVMKSGKYQDAVAITKLSFNSEDHSDQCMLHSTKKIPISHFPLINTKCYPASEILTEQTAPESTDESGNCEACMDQPGIKPTEDFLSRQGFNNQPKLHSTYIINKEGVKDQSVLGSSAELVTTQGHVYLPIVTSIKLCLNIRVTNCPMRKLTDKSDHDHVDHPMTELTHASLNTKVKPSNDSIYGFLNTEHQSEQSMINMTSILLNTEEKSIRPVQETNENSFVSEETQILLIPLESGSQTVLQSPVNVSYDKVIKPMKDLSHHCDHTTPETGHYVFSITGENSVKDTLLLVSAVESDYQPSCIKDYMDQIVLESSKIKETNGMETKLQPEEQEPVRAGSNEEEMRREIKADALNEATEECNQDEELEATEKIMAQGTLLAWKVLRESLKELREEATEGLVQFCKGLKQKNPMKQGSREKQSIEERRQQRKSWSSDDIQAMRDENGEVDRERDDGREETDRSLDQKWLSDKGRTEVIQTKSRFSGFFQNKLANNRWRGLSRTKKSTLEHRELIMERSRFIHHQRCLCRQSMCSTQLTMEQEQSGEAGESEGKGAREPGNHKWNLRNKEKGEEEEPEKNEEQKGQKWLGKSKDEPGKGSMHKKIMQRRAIKVITTKTTGVVGTTIKGIREMEKNKQTENTTGKAELKKDTAVKADQKANMAREKQTGEPKNQKESENWLKKVEYGITLGGSIYIVEEREGEKMTIGPCTGHPDTTREQKSQSECHRSTKDTMEVMVREAQVRAIEQVQSSQSFDRTQRSKETCSQDYLSDSMDSKAKGRAVEGKKEEGSSSRKAVPKNTGKGPKRRGGPPDMNPKGRDGVHLKAVERRDRMVDWCSCSEVPDITSGHGVPRHTEHNYLVNKQRFVKKKAQECQMEYAGVKQYTDAGRTGWREWRRRKNKSERGGNKISGVVSRGKSKGQRDGDKRYAHRWKQSPEDEAEGYCVTRSGRKGTWEVSVCESDPLCDTAGLVSPPNPESQIRNRRLSPGSGNSGGGGGGGGRVNRDTCQNLPPLSENHTHRHPYGHSSTSDRDKERRGQPHSRSFRKEAPRAGRAAERGQRERWVEDSLSLLKPPPAFPVQDSPAKLQPAVSYASKVKQGGAGSVAEDLPGIGVLLQNQWGLSFISDSPQNADSSGPTAQNGPSHGSPLIPSFGSGVTDPAGDASLVSDGSVPTMSTVLVGKCGLEAESPPELLLGCRHLVEALRYHTQEWDAIYRQHEEDPTKVIWYKDLLDHPA